MTWSRRQFLTGVGVLAAVSGTAGRVVAKTLNINGVRYGMVHDESLCIGCTACMDACREVNKVPEGVSRRALTFARPVRLFATLPVGLSMLIRISASVVSTASPPVRTACALSIRSRRRRTNAISAVRPICRPVSCPRALRLARRRR